MSSSSSGFGARPREGFAQPSLSDERARTHNLFTEDELSYLRSVRTGVEQSMQKGR